MLTVLNAKVRSQALDTEARNTHCAILCLRVCILGWCIHHHCPCRSIHLHAKSHPSAETEIIDIISPVAQIYSDYASHHKSPSYTWCMHVKYLIAYQSAQGQTARYSSRRYHTL